MCPHLKLFSATFMHVCTSGLDKNKNLLKTWHHNIAKHLKPLFHTAMDTIIYSMSNGQTVLQQNKKLSCRRETVQCLALLSYI